MAVRQMAWLAGVAMVASGCTQVQTSDVTGATGAALGGVFGGLFGSQFGQGTGQLAFTAVGSSLGALFGGAIGRSVGDTASAAYAAPPAYQGTYQPPPLVPSVGFGADQAYVSEAQAVAASLPIGQSVAWDNPNTGNFGTITALRDGTSREGYYCRQFENELSLAGQSGVSYSVACRFADGSWRTVQ